MIVVEQLYKRYGSGLDFAVRDMSFRVSKGEVVGFLGPNGAGKTTTLRVLSGYLGATSGRVVLGGRDAFEEPLRARQLVGYMPENVPLYPEMRASEYLSYRAELKGIPRRKRSSAVEESIERARIGDVAQIVIAHLSRGYRQRVGLADALLGNPPVLILDEPTAGLDPNQVREVRDLIRRLGRERAVLVSTHILSEVEATCDRALVIAKGRLLAEGSLEELRKLRQARSLRIVLGTPPAQEIVGLVEQLPGVETVEERGAQMVVRVRASVTDLGPVAEEVSRALVHAGCGLREVTPVKPSLEDIFAELTREPELERAVEEGLSAKSASAAVVNPHEPEATPRGEKAVQDTTDRANETAREE